MNLQKYNIAVDTMGTDAGATDLVLACRAFAKANSDVNLHLIGDEVEINSILRNSSDYPNILVVSASESISADDNLLAFRSKPNASLPVALQLVKSGVCNAIISPGSTAHFYAGALTMFGTLPTIDRPALLAQMQNFTYNKPLYLIDAGANLTFNSQQALSLVKLVCKYLHNTTDNKNIKLGFLCASLMKPNARFSVNNLYRDLANENDLKIDISLVKPDEIFFRDIDIIFCDGWVGNLTLKTLEGIGIYWTQYLKNLMSQATTQKQAMPEQLEKLFAYLKTKFTEWLPKFSYHSAGGAVLFGLNRLCYKMHGSANYVAVTNCLQQCYQALSINLINQLSSA